jgi:hypothetical protein
MLPAWAISSKQRGVMTHTTRCVTLSTNKFCVVTLSEPILPGIFLPFHTLPGS